MAILDIQTRVESQSIIVALIGEIDPTTIASFKDTVANTIQANPASARLVLDCSQLSFINSEGIGVLMSLHTSLTKKEKKIVFVAVQPQVLDVFDLIGLTKMIPYYPDLASAQ